MSRHSFELEHGYGPRVHVLDNVYLLSALARIGSPDIAHRDLMALLRSVYHSLLVVSCGHELPRVDAQVPTRMAATHGAAGVWKGEVFDPATPIVVVDIVRAGIVPSQVCFELLTALLPERNVRLDHLNMSRVADQAGHMVGVDLSGSKIGGSVEGATLILPDPVGATGSTTVRAIEHYKERHGKPARVIALPMISTPEYLRRVLDAVPELVVYTARVDRGLSDAETLARVPGEAWAHEKGLDAKSYIVPGAGGMGEVINNSWC